MMNGIGSYDSGSEDEPPAKRQCALPRPSGPASTCSGPKDHSTSSSPKAPSQLTVGIACPARKPPAPKAMGPSVAHDLKPLEQAKQCKDLSTAGDVLSLIQKCGMSILDNGAASCHVLAEIANRLDEANKKLWAETSEVKSLVMAVKNALWYDVENSKKPMKPSTFADGLFGLMYLRGMEKDSLDEATRQLVQAAAGKWASESQQKQPFPSWPTEAFVRAAWCLSHMNFLQVKMERKAKELAREQPLIKQLVERWLERVSSDKSGDLVSGLGAILKLPEMIRLEKEMQRSLLAKVVLGIPHMQPWHILAVAASVSKLEGPEYGLDGSGVMQAIRKRLPKLREVMPEANCEWLEQLLERSATVSEGRQTKEEEDQLKSRRWSKEESAEYAKTRHWTAKNAAYFTDHNQTKVTPYQSRFRK